MCTAKASVTDIQHKTNAASGCVRPGRSAAQEGIKKKLVVVLYHK
jgi:hypothetical protein